MGQAETEGLHANQQAYQQCFIGHSQGASWRHAFEWVCNELLPQFGLKPWYAGKHYKGSVPLREKVVEMIATTRYGIYDLSSWRSNEQSTWTMPRNVLIELGMAIALNRPMLLLRHGNNRECGLPLPACLEGIEIGEFSDGKKMLRETLQALLPSLTRHSPQQDWLNRYCHFGGLQCSSREAHPQTRQWGKQEIHLHLADGTNPAHVARSDFRDMIEEEVLSRFSHLDVAYLDDLACPPGRPFLLCARCQQVRSSAFAIYRITPHTSADTFIAIGMSLALEKQFGYTIPKMLLADTTDALPSLLKGYEIIVEHTYAGIRDRLNTILPQIIEEVKQTTWKPQSLPFEVFLPEKEISTPEVVMEQEKETATTKTSSSEEERDDAPPAIEESPDDAFVNDPISRPARFLLLIPGSEDLQEYPLDKTEILIGRAPSSDILLSRDKLTSRHHATVRYENGQYVLYDERSVNGTFVNGRYIEERTPVALRNGDHIGIGEHELIFSTSPSFNRDVIEEPMPRKPVNLSISYAHRDRRYLDQLREHLLPLQRQGLINSWYDGDLVPGTNTLREIEKQLQTAEIILLLISANFLASEFGYGVEMPAAMERHALGTATLIPIILSSCDWESSPFLRGFTVLPEGGRPVSTWRNQDDAFRDIAEGIRRVIEDRQRRS